jgi:IS30 family transposase
MSQEPGHWEGDAVIGVDKHFSILTLVERRSGFAIIKKLKARTTLDVNAAAIQAQYYFGMQLTSALKKCLLFIEKMEKDRASLLKQNIIERLCK